MTSKRFPLWSLLSILVTGVSVAHAGGLQMGFYDNAKGSPVIDLIHSATSTLDMELYEMDDPAVISAVRDALKRGVKVHIVKEPTPVGAACKVFQDSASSSQKIALSLFSGEGFSDSSAASCDDQQQLVNDVNQAGGKYVPYNKSTLCGDGRTTRCLQHGKLVVVDSAVAMVATGNLNTTSLCDAAAGPKVCNRDYNYLTNDSDEVKSLQAVTENDLNEASYDVASVITGSAQSNLTVGPNSLQPLVDFIKSARTSISVQNQYLKEPTLNQALMDAAQSGIQVQVMVSSACSYGKPSASETKSFNTVFSAFDQAGVKSYIFSKNNRVNGHEGYLHAKGIVVDGNRAWVGSVNGSTQAETINREFGVFFSDPAEVRKLDQLMASDFANQDTESWQDSLQCAENSRSKK